MKGLVFAGVVGGPYNVFEIPSGNVNQWVKILQKERTTHEKLMKKKNRKSRKQTQKRIKNNTPAERFQVLTF